MQLEVTTETLEYEFNHKTQQSYYKQKVVLQVDDWKLDLSYSGYLSWGSQWHSEYDDSSYLDASFKVETITHADKAVSTEGLGFCSKLDRLLDECVHVIEDTSQTNRGRLEFSFDFHSKIESIIKELDVKRIM